MTRYLVLLAYDPRTWESATAEEQQEYVDAHAAFEAAVDARGRRVSSAPLADADTATTVRHDGEHVVVTDGPFAETAEMIAGYYDVELPDLDAVIAAVALLPRSYATEIRPTIELG